MNSPRKLEAGNREPVVIVGAGMVGLTLAIDLLRKNIPVVVLEKSRSIAEGSRSICQAKRSLEIWDRLGVGEAIRDRGCTWKIGRVFHRDREVFHFDLLPEVGHKMPAFVNLQQPILEEILRTHFLQLGGAIRFEHELVAVKPHSHFVQMHVRSPEGEYSLEADWMVSCEGVRSLTRRALGLRFEGEVFEDKFLICDVKMKAKFPAERWFWFEPTFHPGQTTLLHRQADDVWRIDLQLGWDADPEEALDKDKARSRIERLLGHTNFDFEWISLYVFQCRTLESYLHNRVIFAGDSAHQVSPFGARGGNGGVQDVDNLAWKLARVINGTSPTGLLETYNAERILAAKENILHSTRATNFMTPRTPASKLLRDETLNLASRLKFAQSLVNSGRLSAPAHYSTSSLNTPDEDEWSPSVATAPGSPAVDAPISTSCGDQHLLGLLGNQFAVVAKSKVALPCELKACGERIPIFQLGRDFEDSAGLVSERYDLRTGSVILFRPDQHVAMRRRTFQETQITGAMSRAIHGEGVAVR